MSRRAPNPAAERAAQNQATIKNLLKLEANKVCADCKRNKHPRWASWNLGIFICIRCSGIHRGMGTHISRVKSVDLDSWTDEQLQSVLNWGNARANKYWEHKLAPGHAPSESKIENFIRTKYELKRWVMDGPRPDPSTLDADGDDDVPLSLVKEKQSIERKESLRKAAHGQPQPLRNIPAPQGDLIGGDDIPRASTVEPPASRPPPKAEPAPPKVTSTKDSLLGLDFLGESAAPPRPASTTGVSAQGGQSRPDLKQSILSLYASAPKPQAQPQHQHSHSGSFGGMASPTLPQQQQQQGFGGGFNDAFGGLSISGTGAVRPAPSDPFASLGGGSMSPRPQPQTNNSNSFGALGGGSFFNQKPAQPSQPSHQQKPSGSGMDLFGSFTSPAPAAPPAASQPKPAQASSSAMGDLFDLSAPSFSSTTSPPPAATAVSPPASSSVFNLSSPQAKPAAPAPASSTNSGSSAFNAAALGGADVWGGGAWGSTETKPKSPEIPKASTNDFGGWGGSGGFASTPIVPSAGGGFNPAPKVSADEEFGGWASSTGPSAPTAGGSSSSASKPPGGDDDLFSNVWG
jgi:stromal membrane-associated protein